MPKSVLDYLQWRVDMTLAGHIDLLASCFRYPLQVGHDTGSLLVKDHVEMTQMVETVRADWQTRGVAKIVVELTDLVEGKNGRFRAWAIYWEYTSAGELLSRRDSVQYCQRTKFGIRTELFETITFIPVAAQPVKTEAQ